MAITSSQRALLQNRYSVAKYRAARLKLPFKWATFPQWLAEVTSLAPEGADLTRATIGYDKDGEMKLGWPTKQVARQMRKVDKALQLTPENRKIMFAVELMQRIMTPGQEELREKIMAAAEVAGIDLQQ